MGKLIKTSFLAIFIVGFLWIALLSASIYTYTSLTSESVVAEIRFDVVGEQEYLARLRTGDLCDEQSFLVLGDQWRIDAEFLKWKYWAIALGLDSQYRLDRFQGRYRVAEDQNSRPTLAHDLKENTAVDVASLSGTLGRLNFLTDASYGSSTYQNIETDRTFHVYRTQTGLITRTELEPAPRVGDGGLVVEITRACGGEPSYWERFSAWLNDWTVAATS